MASTDAGSRISYPELCSDLKMIAAQWRSFGGHINFTQDEINRVEINVSGQVSKTEHCFPLVLDAWLKGQGGPCTKKTLVEAVKLIGFGSLSRRIRDQDDFKLESSVLLEELKECKAKYSQLGVYLGLDKSLINGFEKYSGNVEECLMRLLDIYMNDKSPSMEEICKAVKLVSFANLSEDLRKKYEGRHF